MLNIYKHYFISFSPWLSKFSNIFILGMRKLRLREVHLSSVQSLSLVRLFATPWTAACQASLSISISQSLLKLMSIELVMSSSYLISSSVFPFSSCLWSFPATRHSPVCQFASGGQSTRASASASVLPVNIQDWFPLALTGLISLQSKGLSRVFSILSKQNKKMFKVKKK